MLKDRPLSAELRYLFPVLGHMCIAGVRLARPAGLGRRLDIPLSARQCVQRFRCAAAIRIGLLAEVSYSVSQ
jgi:hypothetical protein